MNTLTAIFKMQILVLTLLMLPMLVQAQSKNQSPTTNPQMEQCVNERILWIKTQYPERFAKMDETDLQLFREQEMQMMQRENLLTDNGEIMPPKGISDNSRVSTNDSLALVALYNATGGPGWETKTNWLTGPMSTWYGIDLDYNGFVYRIDLNYNNLSGNIPPEIGNLSNLQYLSLYLNQLTGGIPPEIGNLTNLERLYLFDNQLSDSIPAAIGNLTNLQQLELSGNPFSGSIPPEIGNLTNLERLYLAGNQLNGSIPAAIGNLTNLEELYLNYNQLSGSIPAAIGNLTNLQNLYLDRNQLCGNIPDEIGNLTNLERLYLYNNQLTGSIPPEIGNLINLQSLLLDSNQLTGGLPPEIGNLANLYDLNLHSNQLNGSIPDEMCNLNYLDYFYFYNNYFDLGSCPAISCLANHRVYMADNGSQLNGYNLLTDCEISVPVEIGVEQATICNDYSSYFFGDIIVTDYTSIEWTTNWGSGYFDDPYSLNPSYYPIEDDYWNFFVEIVVRVTGDYGWAEDAMYLYFQNCSVQTVIGLDDVWTCADGSGYYFGSVSQQNFLDFEWYTTNGTGFFDDPFNTNPTYYPSEEDYLQGSVEIIVDAFGDYGPSSDIMTIHFIPQPCSLPVEIIPNEQLSCANNIGYSWGVNYNGTWMVEWFIIDGSGNFDNEWNFYPTYYPSIQDYMEGSVILGVTAEGEYGIAQDYIVLTFQNPPEVSAGVDATIAAGETFTLTDATANNYAYLSWTSTGDGTFNDTYLTNPVYTPGLIDMINGQVSLCLYVWGYWPCSDIQDCLELQITNIGIPDISINPFAITHQLYPDQTALQYITLTNNGDGNLFWILEVGQEKKSSQSFNITGDSIQSSNTEVETDEIVKGSLLPETDGSGGTETYGYIWQDSNDPGGPEFDWVDISTSGTLVTGLTNSNFAGPFPIPFSFSFYGNEYSNFFISPKGYISFEAGSSISSNIQIPNSFNPNNFIAWCWDNLWIRSFTSVYYQGFDDKFIIQFKDYGRNGQNDAYMNAEVILFASGNIVIQYLNTANGFNTQGCTIGIENQLGTDGLQVAYNTAYIQENLAVELIQWCSIDTFQGMVNPGNSQNIGLSFFSYGLEPGKYETNLKISSNDPDNPLTSIPVTLTVVDKPLQNPDSLALVALYNATNGPNWTNKTNWLTGPLNTWYGITVTNGYVTYIHLPNNNLTGFLPAEIGNLSHLEFLYLYNNNLSGSIPPEIGNQSSLQLLHLYNNQLTGNIPPETGNLSNLINLDLSDNQLSGGIPDEFGNLSNLYDFNLSVNQLSGIMPESLCNMNSLYDFYFYNNYFDLGSCPAISCLLNHRVYLGAGIQLNGIDLVTDCNTVVPVEIGLESDQVCSDGLPYYLGSTAASEYNTIFWYVEFGTGYFDDPNSLHPSYYPSEDDYLNGSCMLVVRVTGDYGWAEDALWLYFQDCNNILDIGVDFDYACFPDSYFFGNTTIPNNFYLNWMTYGTGYFDCPMCENPVYFPSSEDLAQGSVQIELCIMDEMWMMQCDNMILYLQAPPEVFAGSDAVIDPGNTFTNTTSSAENHASLLWQSLGDGSFDNTGNLNPVYTPGSGDLQNDCVSLVLIAYPLSPCTIIAQDTIELCFTKNFISNVNAAQRIDGSKLVDIYYDLNSQNAQNIFTEVSFDGGTVYQILTNINGDAGSNVSPGIGKHIVWDAGIEIPEVSNDSTLFRVTAGTSQWQCGQPFTDTRDGQIYATVQIGTQCWMAENLNIGNMLPGGSQQSNNGVVEKYCYNNDESNCNVYGGLYQWNEMMQYTTSSGVSGICPPEGEWRLPTDADWCLLTTFLDPSVNCSGTGFIGTNAGGKIKSTGTIEAGTGLWSGPNTGATNSSSFTALPGARYAGSFSFLGTYGYFWSSSQKDASNMWFYSASASSAEINRNAANFGHAYSVRCIKN